MSREKRLVFGEVAEQYEEFRPSYPNGIFDEIMSFGELAAGDCALEIGAGTGKATMKVIERGLLVHALEPSPEMAALLRAKGVEIEETTFEEWPLRAGAYRLVYAAQAWHWVGGDDRYERAAATLAPGGTLAIIWSRPQEFEGALGAEIDAIYDRLAPEMRSGSPKRWRLDETLDEIAGCAEFGAPVKREVTWTRPYTTRQYVLLSETHSDHRVLSDDRRTQILADVAKVIDAHGGRVDVVYDTLVYLARRQ